MKKIFVLLLILFSPIDLLAQSLGTNNCFNADRYKFREDILYPEIEIKVRGKWETFRLLDEIADLFQYECEEIELNGYGSKELVIRWSNALYGSGGGTTTKGVQIWDLDSGIRLLNEIVSCSEEIFPRDGASYYFVECKKQIELINQTIKIYKKVCETQGEHNNDIPEPTSNCKLTIYDEGEYVFVNEKLEKK